MRKDQQENVPAHAPSITYKLIKQLPRSSQLGSLIGIKAQRVIARCASHPMAVNDVQTLPADHAMALALLT